MTREQEEFIKILNSEGYSYDIEGDKIIVTHEGNVFHDEDDDGDYDWLTRLETIPPNVIFNTGDGYGNVYLGALKKLPTGVEFITGNVYLDSLEILSPGTEFNNGSNVRLNSLKIIPTDVKFNNGGSIDLSSLKKISYGVEFNNGSNVKLDSLFGGWIGGTWNEWKGKIKDIDSKRLLNLMIKKEMFI